MTNSPLGLIGKLDAVLRACASADIETMIGGGLALMFHVDEPRTTIDIDLQVYPPDGDVEAVVTALSSVVEVSADARRALDRDQQVRLMWDLTPIDIFLPVAAFHEEMRARSVQVTFPGIADPVTIISATDLTVLKALFNRTKDWADIEAMITAGTPDVALAGQILDGFGQDEAGARLRALISHPPA